MPSMSIMPRVDETGGLPAHGFNVENIEHLTNPIAVASLEHGMDSGKPSVSFCFELPDGRTVVAETSLELFLSAARGLAAAHGYEHLLR